MTRKEFGKLEALDVELDFLKKAIEADDPKAQLLLRVEDARRQIRQLIRPQ